MDSNNTAEYLKDILLETQEPLIIKNVLKWKILEWDLEKWSEVLKDEELQFRLGKNSFTKEPQWETTTTSMRNSFKNFLSFTERETQEWMYYDYSYLMNNLLDADELQKSICWKDFGFPHLTSKESTIWIGSKGAHTSCHVDIYGCNMVSQVFGRKQWILFPPEQNLRPTRIPYEESTVFSKLNFFSPTLKEFKGVDNCRKVILNPGDVLFVPNKWWHYVENMDNVAISINTWIPLPDDDERRLDEALVMFFFSGLQRQLSEEFVKTIFNPNSLSTGDVKIEEVTKYIELYRDKYETSNKRHSRGQAVKKQEDMQSVQREVTIENCPHIQKVNKLSSEEFRTFLQSQQSRFDLNVESASSESKAKEEFETMCKIVNAFTDPDVIELIKIKFLQK